MFTAYHLCNTLQGLVFQSLSFLICGERMTCWVRKLRESTEQCYVKQLWKIRRVQFFFYKTLLGLIGRRRLKSRRTGKRVLGGSGQIHHGEVTAASLEREVDWGLGKWFIHSALPPNMGTGDHPILDLIFLDLQNQKSGVDDLWGGDYCFFTLWTEI